MQCALRNTEYGIRVDRKLAEWIDVSLRFEDGKQVDHPALINRRECDSITFIKIFLWY